MRQALPEDTVRAAYFLLGKLIVRDTDAGRSSLRIVETEAYPPGDEAAHAYRGPTPRNLSLFRPPGHAYVYRAYGVSWMLNVATEAEGVGAGVLLRAGAPEEGAMLMAERRGAVPARDLARGPGRLAQALAVDRALDGVDLCRPGALWLADDGRDAGAVGTSTRIGLTRAVERKWRFFLKGSRFVSGPAWLNADD